MRQVLHFTWTNPTLSCKICRCAIVYYSLWDCHPHDAPSRLEYFWRNKLANIRSQIKRNRQNEKRRQRNRIYRGQARTYIRRARVYIENGEVDEARAFTKQAIMALDKAAMKGVIHKNNASRRKSRLMKQLAALEKNTTE